MMMPRKARSGFTYVPWMIRARFHNKKRNDSIRRGIDRLIESLSFEPINFHEVKSRIIYLMSIEGKRK